MEEYVGKTVQLIYNDRNGNVSIRNIRVISIVKDVMKAYCYSAQSIRLFYLERIVDVEVIRNVGRDSA
ncbi:hypothetical protein B1748_35455 [Paenibacillus sp. MY03]|jgi:predicted DNA-binding transcriptional regulator YafY|uniref:WYL domain-containing protein n=1 Tax=Paenibacillus agaridevorans TaxID=171404 RepID=A0A2R5F1N1_9BACL|nr:hypothetical protein B1748_35455 [Paenibacillus sp. MY03]GBG10133.1 hypothetical protein PAT3040_04851 [Paenibacillus agaridevorans]